MCITFISMQMRKSKLLPLTHIHRKSTNLKSNKKTHLCPQSERNPVCPYSSVQPNENPFRTHPEHQALLESCRSSMKSSKEGKSFVTKVYRDVRKVRGEHGQLIRTLPDACRLAKLPQPLQPGQGPGSIATDTPSDPLLGSETRLGSRVSPRVSVYISVYVCAARFCLNILIFMQQGDSL